MTDREKLERGYRRLLAWYPAAFRRENGQELLAVLMAGARDGQRRPDLAGSADLIRSGLGMRLRPSIPESARTVRAAVRLMYAGAAITALGLGISILSLAFIGGGAARLHLLGHTQPLPVAITVGVTGALVLTGLWLWMARENARGRNWARILSTVLFGLATLHLLGSADDPVDLVFALVSWLVGVAAVWLLWRPASKDFFEPQAFTRTEDHAQPSPRPN